MPPDQPVSELDLISELLQLWDASNEKNAERNQRLDALELRIAALEARKSAAGVRWAGQWKNGRTFHEGELVTFDGSLWVCTRETSSPPKRCDDYTLIVKQGAFDDR
jgi:hypothetical protein